MYAVNVATSGTRTTTYCATTGAAAPSGFTQVAGKEVAPPFHRRPQVPQGEATDPEDSFVLMEAHIAIVTTPTNVLSAPKSLA